MLGFILQLIGGMIYLSLVLCVCVSEPYFSISFSIHFISLFLWCYTKVMIITIIIDVIIKMLYVRFL